MKTTISPDFTSCHPLSIIFCALLLCCFVGCPDQQAPKSEGTSDIGVTPSAVASGPTPGASAKGNTPRKVGYSDIWRDTKLKAIIIFVHGITGDSKTTWTNKETGATWPELILHDHAFDDADVLSYGYSSPQNEPALLIPELAVQMRDTLEELGALNHDRVVFVAHSMGGLIVRSMMLLPRSEDFVKRVRCLFLLATPHLGSDLANVAKYFFKNPDYAQLGPHGRGSFCNDLIQNYLRAGFDTPCYAVYETQPTYGAWIVSSEGALILSNREPHAIGANHTAICQPKDAGADVYNQFRNAFLQSLARADTNITVRVLLNRINGPGLSRTAVFRANDETQVATTDQTGTCHLILRDTKPGDQVTLSANRDKFTVVDPDALRITVPSDPQSEIQIVFCDVNEVEKWRQQLLRDKKQQDINQRFASMAPAEQPVRERLTAQKLSSEKLEFLISPIPPKNNGYLSLARALFSNGRSEDALNVLQKSQADNLAEVKSAIETIDGFVQSRLLLAQLFINKFAFNDARQVLQHLVEEVPNHLAALVAYAGFNQETRRYDAAETYYKRAIALTTATQQVREKAIALTALGETYRSQNKLKDAQQVLQEALNIERPVIEVSSAVEEKVDLATTLNDLGAVLMDLWQSSEDVRPEEAEKAFTESIQIRRTLADSNPYFKPYLGKSINNLAVLYLEMNRLDESRPQFEEAISYFRELTNQDRLTYGEYFADLLANYANNLILITEKRDADANMAAALTKEAGRLYTEAISIFQELYKADPVSFGPELADVLINQAGSISDHETASQSIGEAVELLQKAYFRDPQTYEQSFARALYDRASLEWLAYKDSSKRKTQFIDSALKDVERSIQIRDRLKVPRDMATSLSLQALIYEDMKNYQTARQAAQAALDWNEKSAVPEESKQSTRKEMNDLLARIRQL